MFLEIRCLGDHEAIHGESEVENFAALSSRASFTSAER